MTGIPQISNEALVTSSSTPEIDDGVAQAFQSLLTKLMSQPAPASTSEPGAISLDKGSLFDKFLKGNPLELSDPNDSVATDLWLNKIEKIFTILDYSSEQKVRFAEYKLQGAAKNWWRMIKQQFEGRENELTWEKFLELFNDKYYPANIRQKKQMEFHSLEQGNMSVIDYETKFVELSRFAPNQVAKEEDRMFMFQRGLRPEILSKVQMLKPQTYGESIRKATLAEDGMEIEKLREQGTKRDREATGGGRSNKVQNLSDQPHGESKHPSQKTCPKCDRVHAYSYRCDGYPRKCFNCGRTGHLQHECRFGPRAQQQSPTRGRNWNEGQRPGQQGRVFTLTGKGGDKEAQKGKCP